MYVTGQRIEMKKNHACGGNTMKIIRTGADIKVECERCGTRLMFAKHDFDRKIKKILENIFPVDN